MTWQESGPVYFQVTTVEGKPLTVSMSALQAFEPASEEEQQQGVNTVIYFAGSSVPRGIQERYEQILSALHGNAFTSQPGRPPQSPQRISNPYAPDTRLGA